MLKVNDVLKYNGQIFRILSLLGDQIVWINMESPKGLPSLMPAGELSEALDDEQLVRAEDPYADLALVTPETGSLARTKRDQNFALISHIINEPLFYDPKVRSTRIKEALEEHAVSKPTLYKLLRRYWQRGQTPNALLPDYKNSGGKGKRRKGASKKLGRPRKHTPGLGAIVTEETERLFRLAIERHLLKEKEAGLSYAHRRFVTLFKNHFPDVENTEIPTRRQMEHFLNREYGITTQLKKKTNPIKFNKDVRQLSSTATANTLGPGSRYEIDATIADIYLVSDSDRRNIVGRPVIYFVKDVFSRMIAGFYVGFENPSYATAVQALTLAMTDKVELCAKYGFKISEEDWPTIGLPDTILADRGELLSHQIESLESSFSIRIENTPPYRGDAKGIVERTFRTVQAEFKPFAPGVVTGTKIKKHGDRDYRTDAALTVREFKKIILSSILMHNRFDVLEKYDREPDMPADLEMTPLSIWNWGIQHRTGRLRSAPKEALWISLLPRAKATISDLGISVFGVYYTCSEIIKRGWLHRAKEVKRPVGLQAAYDPGSADTVYLFPSNDNREFWACSLTPRSREFAGASFWDVWQIKEEQKKTTAISRQRLNEKRRQHEEFIAKTIQRAQERASETGDYTNAERIRGIRTNRENEKIIERQQHNQKDAQKTKAVRAKTIPFKDTEVEDYSYPDLTDEIFGSEDK